MIEQDFFIKMLALTSRATLARRVGKFLAMLGIHLVLIGIVTKLFSPTFLPSKSTFSLDVPESIIRTEASTPGASLGINSTMDVIKVVWDTQPIYNALTIPQVLLACFMLYFAISKREFGGIFPLKVIMIVLLFLTPKILGVLADGGVINRGEGAERKIERLLDDNNYVQLLDYIKSSNPKAKPGFLPFDYVVAQIGIKEGKPDITAIKKVINGYNTNVPFANVPGQVRYALEMVAYNEIMSSGAKHYKSKRFSISAFLSKLGALSAFMGAGVLLLGGGLLWLFRLLTRQVNLMKTNYY